MTRKSPIKHHVRKYHRKTGKVVYDYDRGHGTKKLKVSKPRLSQKETTQSNSYLVKLIYPNLSPETYPITPSSYPEAIELALLSRSHITPPNEIEASKQ